MYKSESAINPMKKVMTERQLKDYIIYSIEMQNANRFYPEI